MSNTKYPYSLVGDCIVKDTPENVMVQFPPAMFHIGVGNDILAQRTRMMESWVGALNRAYENGYYDGYNQKSV